MIASHGRARRAGRSWLIPALAAATLTGANPALACHISSHAKPHVAADDTFIPGPGTAQHAEGGPAVPTPASLVPPVITPTALSPTKPAVTASAETLPTATAPSVETFNTDHPHGLATPLTHHWGSPMPPDHDHMTPRGRAGCTRSRPPHRSRPRPRRSPRPL